MYIYILNVSRRLFYVAQYLQNDKMQKIYSMTLTFSADNLILEPLALIICTYALVCDAHVFARVVRRQRNVQTRAYDRLDKKLSNII